MPRVFKPGLQLTLVLSFAQLVAWGSCYYAYAVLMEPVQAALGISKSIAAGAYSVGLLVMGFTAIPVGILIDRGRHFSILVAGSVIISVGTLLHAAIVSVWQLYAVWVLIGVGMACTLYESVFAFLIRAYPNDYRRHITFVTLLGGLASTAFWPLTSLMLANVGWRGAFVGLALTQIVGCLLCYLVFLPRRLPVQVAQHAQKIPLTTMLRSRPFVLLALSFSLQAIVIAGMAAHILALLTALGVSTAIGLLAASSIGVMQVLGRIVLLFADSRLNPVMTAKLVVWLLPASILAMLAVGISPWLAFLYAFLFGSCNGMLTIVKGTAAADLISKDRVAMLNGVLATPTAIARAGGPILIAAFWDFFGNPQAALLMLLGVASCAAFALAAAYHAGNDG